MPLDKQEVHHRIERLNRAIFTHNRLNPQVRLDIISTEEDRLIIASRARCAEILGDECPEDELHHSPAFCIKEDRSIYLIEDYFDQFKEKLSEHIDELSDEEIQKLTLLYILLHENIHLSCRERVNNNEAKELFIELYEALDVDMSEFEGEESQLITYGADHVFKNKEIKRMRTGQNQLDELLTDWITCYFITRNYLFNINQDTLFIKLFSSCLDEKSAEAIVNSKEMVKIFREGLEHPFIRDYLNGYLVEKLTKATENISEEQEENLLLAMMSLAYGSTNDLDSLIKVHQIGDKA